MIIWTLLKYIINYVLENAAPELEFFNQFVDKGLLDRLKNVAESDFGRITYTEAIEILEKKAIKKLFNLRKKKVRLFLVAAF